MDVWGFLCHFVCARSRVRRCVYSRACISVCLCVCLLCNHRISVMYTHGSLVASVREEKVD